MLAFVLEALVGTGVYILLAVGIIAWLKATGAEGMIAQVFQGREFSMIVLASFAGGLAPFCSCEVIPFIAALLAAGTPLSAVMAFWLSSPIIDPPMFLITTSALGLDFAVAKTVAAVGFGLLGGLGTMLLCRMGLFANSLRTSMPASCCGSNPFGEKPVWIFWHVSERNVAFRDSALWNLMFLLKWMTLAYLLESLMIHFVPSSLVLSTLGGEGLRPVVMGALIGGPAYLNGYAAIPVVAGMMEQGMAAGAAMSFILAGSVTCIPAAIAVWALVKPNVFSAYIGFAIAGSLIAGLLWATIAP